MMDAKAALEWQKNMGVDEIVGTTTGPTEISRPEEPAAVQPVAPQPSKPQATSHKPPTNDAEAEARKLADAANTLDELREAVENFDGVALKQMAMNTVFADGNPEAKIMLIGEAPGANEDKEGIPFCGDSGKLMDKMFEYAGFSRKEGLYISNTIFWRPPGNRKPTPEELRICRPFVEKHIALIAPNLLVCIGGTAVQGVWQEKSGITKIRGTYRPYSNQYTTNDITSTALFHPSFLLRQPLQKRVFWHDILTMRKHLNEQP